MLIPAPISSRDLVKDIPPISLVIMGAPRSLFFTSKEFIIMELTVSLSWIRLGFLLGSTYTFKEFSVGRDILDGFC